MKLFLNSIDGTYLLVFNLLTTLLTLKFRFRRGVRSDWDANGLRSAVGRGSLGLSKVRPSQYNVNNMVFRATARN